MSHNDDGLTIARERIVEETRARTGSLDLGMLGLDELPADLFVLTHLRRLNLGEGYFDVAGRDAASDIAPNRLDSELHRLAALPDLDALSVFGAELTTLTGIAHFRALQSLDCSGTEVSDLSPLRGLSALQSLNFSQCVLATAPESVWHKASLHRLYLFETLVPGTPMEVLSQSGRENCLASLRAHLRDLGAGALAVPDVKLMVLGTGRVGKTQICRRLRGEDYDARVPSTHGVIVTSAPLPESDSAEPTILHIWDFGGQDIYHGTHALFMRTRAAFLIVWMPEAESSGEANWAEPGRQALRPPRFAYTS